MIVVTATIVSSVINVTATIVTPSGGVSGGTYEIYVDGSLNQSGTSLDFSTETFNISF